MFSPSNAGRLWTRCSAPTADYESGDRDAGLKGERIGNVDGDHVSARRSGKLRNGAPDTARAPVTIAARPREAKTVEDAHLPSGDVGNGFGSRKRRNTFSVMRDTLLS